MNAKLIIFKTKNRILGSLFPRGLAKKTARLFLTPRRFSIKGWEKEAEISCERIPFGNGLSAARWGNSDKKILIMHGWESRATQMFNFVPDLIKKGFEVVGIDAQGHGHSTGERANPLVFAEAIRAADKTFGPFYGAIGHSMGGAAISIAMKSGIRFERAVLISSPNNLFDVLTAFASVIGLPQKAARMFIDEVENEVGVPVKELDVGKVFAELNPDALIIHAKNDTEVPFKCQQEIIKACPELQTYQSQSLGHRRIVRSPRISALISRFMHKGNIQGQHESGGVDMDEKQALAS